MKQLSTLVAIMLAMSATSATAQALSESDIAAAIKAGQDRKFSDLISDCTAGTGFGETFAASAAGGLQRDGAFTVVVSQNAGRIAFLAANAKRLYKSFGVGDVPETLKNGPVVFVHVEPNDPTRNKSKISVAAAIERVVLKSKANESAVLQPMSFEIEPVSWSNLLGAEVTANRAFATFAIDGIKEFPAGDFDVVVITQQGERRCKVGAKDRTRLFAEKR